MMMTRITLFALLVQLSCNPYDPDLGDTPFRCGTDEPRCPEGYGPVQESVEPPRCVCEKGAPGGGGGGEFTCNTDDNEDPDGNETLADPTPTAIGDGPTSWQAADVAVCETGDIDVYAMSAEAGETITATLTVPPAQGMLSLELVNTGDQVLASGELDGSTMRAVLPVPASGDYFARVSGEDSETRNNYTLRLEVASP